MYTAQHHEFVYFVYFLICEFPLWFSLTMIVCALFVALKRANLMLANAVNHQLQGVQPGAAVPILPPHGAPPAEMPALEDGELEDGECFMSLDPHVCVCDG